MIIKKKKKKIIWYQQIDPESQAKYLAPLSAVLPCNH